MNALTIIGAELLGFTVAFLAGLAVERRTGRDTAGAWTFFVTLGLAFFIGVAAL